MHLYIPQHELCLLVEFVFTVDILPIPYIAINWMEILYESSACG